MRRRRRRRDREGGREAVTAASSEEWTSATFDPLLTHKHTHTGICVN